MFLKQSTREAAFCPCQLGNLGEGTEPLQVSVLIYRIKEILVGGDGNVIKIHCMKDILNKKKILLSSYGTEVMDIKVSAQYATVDS